DQGLIPVDKAMKGSGASGNKRRATPRSPPCATVASPASVNIMPIALALIAMLIELCFGYPEWLFRVIGHPASWMGRLIDGLDRLLNSATAAPKARRFAGTIALLLILLIVAAI